MTRSYDTHHLPIEGRSWQQGALVLGAMNNALLYADEGDDPEVDGGPGDPDETTEHVRSDTDITDELTDALDEDQEG